MTQNIFEELGNKVFALETNIYTLKGRCPQQKELIEDIIHSIEQIKNLIKNDK